MISCYDQFTQKEAPCGQSDGERGDEVTTFEPGETITMVWDEYIPHPGHFRISFSVEGDIVSLFACLGVQSRGWLMPLSSQTITDQTLNWALHQLS